MHSHVTLAMNFIQCGTQAQRCTHICVRISMAQNGEMVFLAEDSNVVFNMHFFKKQKTTHQMGASSLAWQLKEFRIKEVKLPQIIEIFWQ